LLAGVSLLAASAFAARPASDWTLRVDLGLDIDYIDPALAYYLPTWQIEYATCLKLVNHPDGGGPRSAELVGEAAPLPRISRDGRVYTFDVRPAFTRFSNGRRVGPGAFVRAFLRAAHRRMSSPAQPFIKDVVGAQAVIDGRAHSVSGIRVRGTQLRIELVERAPDFLARLALPFFCAVPPSLPLNPDGVSQPFPSAGPYVIRRWEIRREIVLERNPHYRGPRPRNAPRVVYTIGEPNARQYERVKSGRTDWIRPAGEHARDRAVASSPLPRTDFLSFDTRPGQPFAEQRLRKAVALVVHRAGIARIGGTWTARPVDHLLPPTVPGYRNARIYPLRGNARAIERARGLARGLVPAKVTLAISNRAPWPQRGAFLAQTLRQIDLEVEVRLFGSGYCFRNIEEDLMYDWAYADYPDAKSFLKYFFDPRPEYGCGPIKPILQQRWHERFAAAGRLSGEKRRRAFGALDIALTRDAVPAVALLQPNELNLFSARIGCFRPHRVYQVSIGSLCLR
jgi:ABC-type oligopeptide transport system substrate-binding subunit